MSNCEETFSQSKNKLEKFYVLAALGMPWIPQEEREKFAREKGHTIGPM